MSIADGSTKIQSRLYLEIKFWSLKMFETSFILIKKKGLEDSSAYRSKSIKKLSYFFWEQQKSLKKKKESIDGLIV
jgi:hypothetical protein